MTIPSDHNDHTVAVAAEAGTSRSSTMKAGVAGAALGVTALLGSFLVLGSGASAQDQAETDSVSAGASSGAVVIDAESVDGDVMVAEFEDPALEAFFACLDQAWETAIGDKDEETLTDAEWEALIDSAEAAEETCEAELPADFDLDMVWDEAEMEALDDFDFDEFEMELAEMPEVAVHTADGITLVDLGDGDGTVTITKSGDEITVDATGDASTEVLDWDDIEEADMGETVDELD